MEKENRKDVNKIRRHAQRAARMVSASSTHSVLQRRQQRQAWKIPYQVRDDNPFLMSDVSPTIARVWQHGFTPAPVIAVLAGRAEAEYNAGRKGGFTLIELLVVVLIIGILAAVALPQYQKAVEKSRATQAITMLKSIGQAQSAYRMANGTCAESFDELDVDIPFTGTTLWRISDNYLKDTRSNNDWSFQLVNWSNHCIVMAGRISGKYQGGGFFYYVGSTIDGMLRCVERTSGGVSLSGEEGRYCAQLFKGTLAASGSSSREYNLP